MSEIYIPYLLNKYFKSLYAYIYLNCAYYIYEVYFLLDILSIYFCLPLKIVPWQLFLYLSLSRFVCFIIILKYLFLAHYFQ